MRAVTHYQKRISGPLLDRIDIHVEVPRVDYEKLTDERLGESSGAIRARVEVGPAGRGRVRYSGSGLPTRCCRVMRTWGRPKCGRSASWMRRGGGW